ncbi:MAG: formate/nitrite transporter family protein [Helicobacteraceae bacterium]|nr:formate/nitrite transporter family protein [Helicobacteraceae bacterium]
MFWVVLSLLVCTFFKEYRMQDSSYIFPVILFIVSGFQHIVANMYYLNLRILLDSSI